MRFLVQFLVVLLVFSSCEDIPSSNNNQTQNQEVIKTVKLKSKQDTVDYSLGIIIGKQMKNYGITQIDEDILLQAINDVLTEQEQYLPIHPDVAKQIVSLYVRQTVTQKVATDLDDNSNFLKNNSKSSSIEQLANGIQYKEIFRGTGKIPTKYDNVTVHYTGKLINGDVFVSTDEDKPVSFDVKASLQGWQEALTRMPEGSEWVIYLPPEYAFGSNGSKNVPPNSVVIYRIKLVEIN